MGPLGGDHAREVTRLISSSRSWHELAAVTHEHGGMKALNDIHLAAAITRLAKVDLSAPPPAPSPHTWQTLATAARHGPGDSGMRAGPAQRPSPVSSTGPKRRNSFVPPPPPAGPIMQLTSLSAAAPRGPAALVQPMQLATLPVPQTHWAVPHALARGSPSAHPAPAGDWASATRHGSPLAPAAPHGSQLRSITAPLAASPLDLYVDLLEELASRCGGADAPPGAMASPGCGGAAVSSRNNPPSPGAQPSSPLPVRVLANGTWAAMRLLLKLGPRLQRTASSGLRPPGGLQGVHAGPVASYGNPDGTTDGTSSGGCRERAGAALRVLLHSATAAAASLEPQHISNLLYSVSQLGLRAPEVLVGDAGEGGKAGKAPTAAGLAGAGRAEAERLVRVLLEASLPKLADFAPQALANSMYAAAALDIRPPRLWMDAWVAAAAKALPLADPQHVSNMLWSLERIRAHPGDQWLVRALRTAALKAPAFTIEGLCMTLWSMARLGFVLNNPSRAEALLPLLAGLRAAAAECEGQDVANGMWAVAQLRLLMPPMPSKALEASAQLGLDDEHDREPHPAGTAEVSDDPESAPAVEALVTTAAAMRHTGLALLNSSIRHLHRYTPQQLANAAWAAAALCLPPPSDWVAQFWPATQAALPVMRTKELAAVCMAAAKLRLRPPDAWLAALLEVTMQAMQQRNLARALSGSQGGDGASGDEAQASTSAASAAGPPALDPVQAALPDVKVLVTGRLLASLLWCVAAWRMRVPAAWMAEVLTTLEALAAEGSLEVTAVATALQAMSRMRLRPDSLVANWTLRLVESLGRMLPEPEALGLTSSAAEVSVGRAPGRPRASDAKEPQADVDLDSRDQTVSVDMSRMPGDGDFGHGAPNGPLGAQEALPSGQGRAARMLLWSLARMRCPVPDDVAGQLALLSAECGAGVGAADGPGCAGGRGGVGPPVTVPVVPEPHGGGLSARTVAAGQVDPGGPLNVCVTLWALAQVGARPRREVMRELSRRAALVAPLAYVSHLIALVRAFDALGFRPSSRFWGVFEEQVSRVAARLTDRQVQLLYKCCLGLRWQLGEEVGNALRLAGK